MSKLTKTVGGESLDMEKLAELMRSVNSSSSKVYKDKDRTLTISGPPTLDPNLKYNATIRDEMNSVESVTSDATLSEIYLWAKEHGFTMIDDRRPEDLTLTPQNVHVPMIIRNKRHPEWGTWGVRREYSPGIWEIDGDRGGRILNEDEFGYWEIVK